MLGVLANAVTSLFARGRPAGMNPVLAAHRNEMGRKEGRGEGVGGGGRESEGERRKEGKGWIQFCMGSPDNIV